MRSSKKDRRALHSRKALLIINLMILQKQKNQLRRQLNLTFKERKKLDRLNQQQPEPFTISSIQELFLK